MMKKAFTLLEVTISITILTILMVFLYKVLDETKISNKKLVSAQERLLEENNLNKIFLEDFLDSSKNLKITQDKNENSIITFSSNNTYHNPFFTNITYLLGKDNRLFRIESKVPFEKLVENSFENEELFFIDNIKNNVESFKILKNKDSYTIFIVTVTKKIIIIKL